MSGAWVRDDQFRDARIHLCDLAGLEIRDCEVSGLRIVDCYGGDVYVAGGFRSLVVNDVDVTEYVEAELDRQHPSQDFRAAWEAVEVLWEATLERAGRWSEATLAEQINGEWSFVETQRHLLFAADAWLGNAVLEEAAAYHPLGLPAGGTLPADSTKLGLTLDATTTLDEVLVPRLARMATMRHVVEELTVAELDRECARKPAEFYPDQPYLVRRCLTTVLREEAEHHRYAVRDFGVLGADA